MGQQDKFHHLARDVLHGEVEEVVVVVVLDALLPIRQVILCEEVEMGVALGLWSDG